MPYYPAHLPRPGAHPWRSNLRLSTATLKAHDASDVGDDYELAAAAHAILRELLSLGLAFNVRTDEGAVVFDVDEPLFSFAIRVSTVLTLPGWRVTGNRWRNASSHPPISAFSAQEVHREP